MTPASRPASRPDLAARLLALPIEARRKLAEQDGPGWWIEDNGRIRNVLETSQIAWGVDVATSEGWAWWPADSLAWMEAAGESWRADSADGFFIEGQDYWYPTPQEAVLAALEAR